MMHSKSKAIGNKNAKKACAMPKKESGTKTAKKPRPSKPKGKY